MSEPGGAGKTLDPSDQHLSQISTTWTIMFQAHSGSAEAVSEAQRRLLERYTPAVYRYLLGSLRDPDAALDVFQEFALRFVRGDFGRANPERGRFRDFLKTSLYHLIVDHQRKRKRRHLPLTADAPEPVDEDESPLADADEQFLNAWRTELMTRAMTALKEFELRSRQPLHTVLQLKKDHPELRSAQMAERLSEQFGKPLTPEWVRKRLYFAREKFTDLLLDEVAQTIEGAPSPDDLEQELIDLGLLEYCRSALDRRREGHS